MTDTTPGALDAAIGYAARGWHIFPSPPGTKKSYRSAEHDPQGRKWGATTDAIELAAYWQADPDANVAIVTGAQSGIWVLDIDTDEGHGVDGFASLARLIEQYGPLPETLTAESPSGSRHYYFQHGGGAAGHIPNSVGRLAPGVDVRGDGGMVIAPPSVKPGGGVYRWTSAAPVEPAPDWLLRLVTVDHETGQRQRSITPVHLSEVEELLSHIDPDAGGYDEWQRVIAGVHDASGGSDEGMDLVDEWSSRGKKYRAGEVAEKWRSFTAGRPGGATVATIAEYAKRAGADVMAIAGRHRLLRGISDPGVSMPDVVSGGAQGVSMPAPGAAGAPDPIELLLDNIQSDPTTAVQRLSHLVAGLSQPDVARVMSACRAYGIKADMQHAVKHHRAAQAAEAGAARYEATRAGPLAHYFIVRNDNGQAVAIDARGDLPPQSRAALRDAWANLPGVPSVADNGTLRMKPAVDHWWEDEATPSYDALGYDPLAALEFHDSHGRRIRNVYKTGHIGPPMPASVADVEPFLYVLRMNYPDQDDQSLLLRTLAHMVQRPGVMLRYAPVLQGTPGCGKGTIAEAVEYAHGRANVAHPSPDVIARDFNDYIHRKTLVVVNEIGDHTKRELSALAEKMKPWITDSVVHIEPKGRPGFDARNTVSWIFTTNHLHCMLATPGERRYMHLVSALQTEKDAADVFHAGWWNTGGDWWSNYYDWWRRGGAEAVRGYLHTYDAGELPSRAPKTSTTAQAEQAGESQALILIREAIDEGQSGFRGGYVSINAVRELLRSEDVRMPAGQFLARHLEVLGYAHSFRAYTSPAEAMRFPAAPGRTRIYCRDLRPGLDPGQMFTRYDTAQAVKRDGPLMGPPGGGGPVVVKMPGV